jgi:hypothetical protein
MGFQKLELSIHLDCEFRTGWFLFVRELTISLHVEVLSTQVCVRQTPHPQLRLCFGCN